MRRELLIGAGPGEWRAVWLEDGVAAELHVERGDIRPAGSVHLGRVVRRVAGLDAALVDIGEARPGFLPLARTPAAVVPDEGAAVVVEVRREAQRGKGALLAARSAAADRARRAGRDPPAQLDPAPGFAAALALRLPETPEAVIADDPAPLPGLRAAFPRAEIALRRAEHWPLDLDAVFDRALAATVALPGGGSLHIEEAQAAVLIDVDTGSPETGSAARTALAANLAAAAAIARELRLRQLGGGIVVDFAALEGRRRRERVGEAMAQALAGDPARPQLLGWTRLGHLEIVRPRRLRSLGEAMLERPAATASPLALAFAALRALYREARLRPALDWRLAVPPAVAAALDGPAADGLRSLEARLGRRIAIAVAAGGDPGRFDIAPL